MSTIFEPQEFSILDVENLRLHYARTCRGWLDRFEAAAERVAAMYDADFVRAWRLYLAGSVAAFTTGSLQLFQVGVRAGEVERGTDDPRAHVSEAVAAGRAPFAASGWGARERSGPDPTGGRGAWNDSTPS